MKKKTSMILKVTLMIALLVLLIAPSVVAAPAGQGLFGDLLDKVTVTLEKLLMYNIRIPHPYPIGRYDSMVPLWGVLSVFVLLFSIFWPASYYIPIFKDEQHKGARKGFCISLSLIVLFGAPITEMLVFSFAGYIVSLGSILLVMGLIFAVWGIIMLWKKGKIGFGKVKANIHKDEVENVREEHEAEMAEHDIKQENEGFKKITNLLEKERKSIGDLKKHLSEINQQIQLVERIRAEPERIAGIKARIIKELSEIIPMVDSERKINNKIKNLLSRIEKLERNQYMITEKEFVGEQAESKLQTKIKNSNRAEKGFQHKWDGDKLKQYIKKVIADEKAVYADTERIRALEAEFEQLGTQAEQHVRETVQQVSNNDFPNAQISIIDAIRALDKQDELIHEIEQIEQRIMGFQRQEFQLEEYVKKVKKQEVQGDKQEGKKIDKAAAKGRGSLGANDIPRGRL